MVQNTRNSVGKGLDYLVRDYHKTASDFKKIKKVAPLVMLIPYSILSINSCGGGGGGGSSNGGGNEPQPDPKTITATMQNYETMEEIEVINTGNKLIFTAKDQYGNFPVESYIDLDDRIDADNDGIFDNDNDLINGGNAQFDNEEFRNVTFNSKWDDGLGNIYPDKQTKKITVKHVSVDKMVTNLEDIAETGQNYLEISDNDWIILNNDEMMGSTLKDKLVYSGSLADGTKGIVNYTDSSGEKEFFSRKTKLADGTEVYLLKELEYLDQLAMNVATSGLKTIKDNVNNAYTLLNASNLNLQIFPITVRGKEITNGTDVLALANDSTIVPAPISLLETLVSDTYFDKFTGIISSADNSMTQDEFKTWFGKVYNGDVSDDEGEFNTFIQVVSGESAPMGITYNMNYNGGTLIGARLRGYVASKQSADVPTSLDQLGVAPVLDITFNAEQATAMYDLIYEAAAHTTMKNANLTDYLINQDIFNNPSNEVLKNE